MLSEHDEIEAKLPADNVTTEKFMKWAWTLEVERFKHVMGPDHYYESGPNVVRHRIDDPDGRHELTVKRRKSDGSTRDRMEIDLHFLKASTTPESVAAFLKAVGFEEAFVLTKEAFIFWIRLSPNLIGTLVIYDVWAGSPDTPRSQRKSKRFIEIEAEKGSNVTSDTAKRHINAWVKKLQSEFELGEPLNDSLYEIFSGKRYQTVESK